mmetsp:Transcript_20383/g.78310  ORF Transcript_20383/g.78310 Transcript_20383/m.78310 type:complete len:313 (+) Transcript_20383:1064-2002(+)
MKGFTGCSPAAACVENGSAMAGFRSVVPGNKARKRVAKQGPALALLGLAAASPARRRARGSSPRSHGAEGRSRDRHRQTCVPRRAHTGRVRNGCARSRGRFPRPTPAWARRLPPRRAARGPAPECAGSRPGRRWTPWARTPAVQAGRTGAAARATRPLRAQRCRKRACLPTRATPCRTRQATSARPPKTPAPPAPGRSRHARPSTRPPRRGAPAPARGPARAAGRRAWPARPCRASARLRLLAPPPRRAPQARSVPRIGAPAGCTALPPPARRQTAQRLPPPKRPPHPPGATLPARPAGAGGAQRARPARAS